MPCCKSAPIVTIVVALNGMFNVGNYQIFEFRNYYLGTSINHAEKILH